MKTQLMTLVGALLTAISTPVWAGEWVVDSYEYNYSTLSDEQRYGRGYDSQHYGISGFYRSNTPVSQSGVHQISHTGEGFGLNSTAGMTKTNHYGGLVRAPYQYFSGTAYAYLTITPVFRWEPNRIYTEDDYEFGIPDPNDVAPQKLWYYESCTAVADRFYSKTYGNERYVYSNESPYPAHHFTVQEVSNGLENEPVEFRPAYNGMTNQAVGSHVMVKDTGGAMTVRGQTRTLRVRVASTASALTSDDSGETWGASARVGYAADIVTFGLMSRLKGDHDPTDLWTDLRPPGYYGASSATIAAGGLETPGREHEADIVMQVKRAGGNWVYGTPLGGIERGILPRLRASNREGVETPAEITEQEGTTNAGGHVLSDVLRSRDKESRMYGPDMVGVYLNNANSNWNPIYMRWASVEWKMGQNGEKPWNSKFILFNSDYTETVWLKAKTIEDKPLVGHTLNLVPQRVVVSEMDEAMEEMVTKIFTTNPQEVTQNAGDPDVRVYYQQDLSTLTGSYLILPGAMSGDDQGVYTGQITVKYSPNFSVLSYQLAVEDQAVYEHVN